MLQRATGGTHRSMAGRFPCEDDNWAQTQRAFQAGEQPGEVHCLGTEKGSSACWKERARGKSGGRKYSCWKAHSPSKSRKSICILFWHGEKIINS